MRKRIVSAARCLGFSFASLHLLGCAASTKVTGEMNGRFLERASQAIREDRELIISSYGGAPEIGHNLAKLIEDARADVTIGALCLSSCAEFILPSRAHLRFSESPLIGFHGNDRIAHWLNRARESKIDICGLDRAEFQRTLFQKYGFADDFWKEIADRLLIVKYDADDGSGCAKISITSELTMWFPDSGQLSQLLNYDPPGPVCADDEACWTARIQQVITPGQRFMVGEQIYLMNDQRALEPLSRQQFTGTYISP